VKIDTFHDEGTFKDPMNPRTVFLLAPLPRIIQYQVVPKVKHISYEWVDLRRGRLFGPGGNSSIVKFSKKPFE
jgi:hypothetical protein